MWSTGRRVVNILRGVSQRVGRLRKVARQIILVQSSLPGRIRRGYEAVDVIEFVLHATAEYVDMVIMLSVAS